MSSDLTEAELDTLKAIIRLGDYDRKALAKELCLHENSVRYRMERIRAKWDMDGATGVALVIHAIRNGYVIVQDTDVVHEFVRDLLRYLPAGQFTFISHALEDWLTMRAVAFIRERTVKAAREQGEIPVLPETLRHDPSITDQWLSA